MLDGAKDKNGNPFDATIDTLQERGVEFRVCNNTLKSRHIDPKRVISRGDDRAFGSGRNRAPWSRKEDTST